MTYKTKSIGALTLLISLGLLTGCGNQVAGGGQPAPQPITTQTGGNLNTNPASNGQGGASGGGNATGSGHPSGGKSGTGKATGKPTIGGKKPNSGASGSTKQTSTGKTNQVTIPVQGISLNLLSTAVSQTGDGGSFVPVSTSIQQVLLPSGWSKQTQTNGSEGTTIRLINPQDNTQSIVEVVQTSARDIEGFYAGQSSGAVTWVVPKQIVEFTLQNPSNPNPDRGLLANVSTGGSIRLDIFLPASEDSVAQKIMDSFLGASK